MRPEKPLALLFTCCAFMACTAEPDDLTLADGGTPGADGSITNDDGGTLPDSDSGVTPNFPESPKANLRFKRAERFRNDVAQALGIPANQVCNEMGQYSCTDFVHKVTLGGTEAYELGLNEPLANTTVTAPIAVERVALAACTKRVIEDLGSASPVIFRDLGVLANGKLADVGTAGVRTSIETLYSRALLRAPKDSEVDLIKQLYRDIDADGQPNPAKDWAILTCTSVLTSVEALFY